MNFKSIFSLLFLEHRYLSYYLQVVNIEIQIVTGNCDFIYVNIER